MKKNLAALALVLAFNVIFNAACLGAGLVSYVANYESCDEVQRSCKEFIAVTCGRVEDCGGDFDECVDRVIDGGFDCDIAHNSVGDVEECLDDTEDLSCDELFEGDTPRSCDDVSFLFEDGLCN